MLITDGIHQIDGIKGAHSYLITGVNPFLVDTGLPGQEERILAYMQKVGLKPLQLSGIVLTHSDPDHVGSVAALANLTKAPVYAHPAEIPFILKKTSRPGIKRFLPMLILPLYGELRLPPSVNALDSDKFFDWEVLFTPGHTPGHIALYRNGIAIVGDLLVGGGALQLAPRFFTWDKTKLKGSVEQLIMRPLRWILPGHGPATPAANRWLDGLTKIR